jgi:hypothetical protein
LDGKLCVQLGLVSCNSPAFAAQAVEREQVLVPQRRRPATALAFHDSARFAGWFQLVPSAWRGWTDSIWCHSILAPFSGSLIFETHFSARRPIRPPGPRP